MQDGTQGPQVPQAPEKKGLGTLAWLGIGCGVLVVLIVVALSLGGLFLAKKAKDVVGDLDFEGNPGLAAARMVVRLSPELEEVAVDEEAGTITIRNAKTGEEATFDFEDVKEGRIAWKVGDREVSIDASEVEGGNVVTVTGDEGTWKLTTGADAAGELPDWVPVYPGAEPEGRTMMSSDEGVTGTFGFNTEDEVSEVISFYRSQLGDQGFAVTTNVMSGDDGDDGGLVQGGHEATKRSVTVILGTEDEATTVAITYSDGK
jgi:hypothetical protein